AVAFARTHPMSAIELVGRKFLAAISSYDAWDLGSVVKKEYGLARMPAIPFAFVLATAFAALWLPDRRRLLPVAMVVFFGIGAMVGTYVTARQRNAIIPATAVLAGCGVAALARLRGRHLWMSAAAILTAGTLLTLESNRAAEDRYVWKTSFVLDAARQRAKAARDRGEFALALGVAQLSGDETLSRQGRPVVLQLGRRAIDEPVADPVAFNAALALARNHYWREAETILVRLLERGYIPERRSRVPSSLHYHLARCLLRQGRRDGIATLLENARVDTPGDADVLALSFATGSGDTRVHAKELATLHDRFTAELALVRALIDTGRRGEAAPRVAKLQREFPEWGRPAQVLRSW
ncbi:MAG TPA: hypothetical protein VE010_18865, partial [Thermoanaerobaculia bacterium]|nr:hypothetical protein [Thermoanaerobaculia bacterium]